MDAGNRHGYRPIFVDSAIRQKTGSLQNLVLVHAARYAADLSYLPLMQALEKRYEGKLRIQTVVSRETVADSLTGRVPALIESGELEKRSGCQWIKKPVM